jgi:hypothetical protein
MEGKVVLRDCCNGSHSLSDIGAGRGRSGCLARYCFSLDIERSNATNFTSVFSHGKMANISETEKHTYMAMEQRKVRDLSCISASSYLAKL